jgi:hypothetical protein
VGFWFLTLLLDRARGVTVCPFKATVAIQLGHNLVPFQMDEISRLATNFVTVFAGLVANRPEGRILVLLLVLGLVLKELEGVDDVVFVTPGFKGSVDDDNKPDHEVPEKFIKQWEAKVTTEDNPIVYGSFKTGGNKDDIVDTFKFLEHQSEHKKKHKYPTFWTIGDKSGKNGYKVCGKTGNLVHLKWNKIMAELDSNGCFKWTHGYTSCPVKKESEEPEAHPEVFI